jgi:hypothetical protein
MSDKMRRAFIDFHSDADHVGPLTWGQHAIWKAISWLDDGGHYFNVRRIIQLPREVSADRVIGALGRLVDRHEALRSRWYAQDGQPVQEILASGAIEVSIVDAGDGDVQAVAKTLGAERAARPLPGEDGMPAWFGLVTRHGFVQAVALVATHQAIDSWSAVILERHLLEYIDDPDITQKPTWQPRDQAEWEQSEAGQKRSESSLRYLERTLRAVPAAMFEARPSPEDGHPGRWVQLGMDSRALAIGATALSARFGVSVSTVLLAATATVINRLTGSSTIVMQLISINRVDPRTEDLVAPLTEDALFTLDVGGVPFADLVQTAHRRAILAYRNARYDVTARDQILATVEAERGERIDLTSYFNDIRVTDGWPSLPPMPATAAEARALTEETSVYLVGTWDKQDSTLFASTPSAPDLARYYLLADTALVPRPAIESCLRNIESIVLETAIGVASDGQA